MKKSAKLEKLKSFFTVPMIITSTILFIIVFVAIFADYITPYDPTAISASEALKGLFEDGHILGTDNLGRDLLSRLMTGTKLSILSAFLVVLVEASIGVPLGLLCGYFGGKLDNLVMRFWDIVCALPTLLLAFVLVAVFGKSVFSGVLALGIVFTPLTAKLSRSLIMTEKSQVYVEAAKSLGYSDARIIFVHILPNCMNTIVSQLTLDVGSAIVSLASLSFLGLSVQAPLTDWGLMLSDGMDMLYKHPIMLVIPAVTIMITSISINIFSDGLQAYLDPSQRRMPTFKEYRKRRLKEEMKKAEVVKVNTTPSVQS